MGSGGSKEKEISLKMQEKVSATELAMKKRMEEQQKQIESAQAARGQMNQHEQAMQKQRAAEEEQARLAEEEKAAEYAK